jgi:hypothetical protein
VGIEIAPLVVTADGREESSTAVVVVVVVVGADG